MNMPLSDKKGYFNDVVIPNRINYNLFFILLTTLFILTLLFLFFAKFTSEIKIDGLVYPDKGIFSVHSPISGYVYLPQYKNNTIKKGEVLAFINDSRTSSLFANDDKNYQEITKKLASLISDDSLIIQKKDEILKYNQINESNINNELDVLAKQKELLQKQIDIKQKIINKFHEVQKQGAISLVEENKEDDTLYALQQQLNSLNNTIIEKKLDLEKFHKLDEDTKIDLQLKKNESDKETLMLLQQFNNYIARKEDIIYAPFDGKVINFVKKNNDFINADEEIMTLSYKQSHNQIIAFLPITKAGRVKLNSQVTIYFSSYNFHRYGVGRGIVKEISMYPYSPESIYQKYHLKNSEPIYEVIIKPTKIPESISIIPGMNLSVAIPEETRTLIQWFFSSLFETNLQLTL
ncbi:hypothetical protein CEP48_00610 [Mergibacter septicus]|uniref:Uncharacterized protein n=1 Tax=Mergibacter septicus TaxID=221402 RepID=A0A8D4IZ56_9PAST|nr:HlyD family secretion protein [Mergibacter septicus]AWX14779.1 hypothetical protein CEP47_00610 [Mergibacter septicus]QDJ14030.1 hypothetical protein CEP48_00610 [Mergibacter septicus]UTU48522.1 HlyD family efflux transporter periplasmic adaptor subunit [Mergibacter septicus]WMR95848.1 HlyD family secretion protein [Mergibacter septicus]